MENKIKEKLNQWKAQAEHLNVQMHLGAAEARDEFEIQKKHLEGWVNDTKQVVEELEDSAEENYTALKTKLEELRLQAALGKADAEDAFNIQQKDLSRAMHEARQEIDKLYDKGNEKTKEFLSDSADQIEHYQTRFDLFRIQLNLGAKEAAQYWTEKKKDLRLKLHEVNQKIDHASEEAGEKWDEFSDEMSEAWKHFKKAFD
ncbi:MAG: hypothetical protein RIC15_06715 [Vicingaceae bacterium]